MNGVAILFAFMMTFACQAAVAGPLRAQPVERNAAQQPAGPLDEGERADATARLSK